MVRQLWMAAAIISALVCSPVFGGEADVIEVEVTREGPRVYRFDVTVTHGDTGWQHYADGWEVLAPDGSVLGKRVLYHPHVNEQPFTRSLSGVDIPEGITAVRIRAHDSVHGHGGTEKNLSLP